MHSMTAMLGALRGQRRHVREALTGLTAAQLWTPVPPTSWAPIAVPHHLALDVERWWFGAVLAGHDDAWRYFDDHPGGAWQVQEDTDVLALYEAECARSDAILARCDPDDRPAKWPDFLGEPQSAQEITLHVIGETATHAGQLDVVRESIDGKTWLILD